MNRPDRPLRDLPRAARYLAGRLAVEALAHLPRPAGRLIGRRLGVAGYWIIRRDRRIARANLSAAWPAWSRGEVAKASRAVFARLGENIYDVAAARRWSDGDRHRILSVSGLEHLEACRRTGRGTILIGGHLGPWELVAVALAAHGIEVVGMSRPVKEARLDRWLDDHRAALGIRTIKANGLSGAREAHRHLASGGVLGLLIDHRIRRGGAIRSFFGRPTRFARGPYRLAQATGAHLVPTEIRRRADGGHEVILHPPIGAEAVDSMIDRSVEALEAMVRRQPEAWAWIHPRWGRPVVALLLALSLVVGGCSEKRASEGPASGETGGPSSTLAGVTLRETIDGRLRWVLRADSSETFDKPSQTVVVGVHVDFYDPRQEITSVLTSDEGVVQRSNNDMTARGHVRLVTTAGDTLTSDRLDWDNRAARVRTDLPFRLSRHDGVLTGVGFESNPDLTNYSTHEVRIDARGRAAHGPR